MKLCKGTELGKKKNSQLSSINLSNMK